MAYCTKEELLRRRHPVRTCDLELSPGRRLKIGPLLPEIRANFPRKSSWEKLLLALHYGIQEPKLSIPEAAGFVNAEPLEAIAVGKRILELSGDYDQPERTRRDETEHFFAALEGIAGMRGER